MIETERFDHNGKTYEIRGRLVPGGRQYRPFLNGEPYGDIVYDVNDLELRNHDSMVIEQIKSDIREGLYEQRLKAARELKGETSF